MSDESTAPESPAPSPTEALAELTSDKEWSADFSGANGRAAQKLAVERKSALLRGDQAEAAPNVPEHLAEAMENSETKPHAERYVPAQSPEDYKFDWRDAENVEHAKEMTALAQETAFAVGANPEFAQATVKHIQERLPRVQPGMSVAENEGSLDEAVARLMGAEAGATIAAATEAVMSMPENGRQWVQQTLRSLDPSSAAWFTARLARTHRAKRP
jgi:hypothetical protein